MNKMSLTARIATVFTIVVTVVLVVAAISFNYFCRLHFERKDAQLLDSKISAIEHVIASADLSVDQYAAHMGNIIGNSFAVSAVLQQEGQILYSSGDVLTGFLQSLDSPLEGRWNAEIDGRHYSGITKVLNAPSGPQEFVAYVAADVTHRVQFFDMVMEWFVYTLISSALLSGALGLFLIRKGLEPIRSLSKTTTTITANRLDTRVSTESTPRELHELVDNFNQMLVRLDESFVRLSGFSADIAHELRTPLNSMLIQFEVWLIKDRDKAEYKEMLFSSLEELRQMSRMVDDMLFLAKSDNHLVVPRRESTDLAAVAASVLEYYEYLAEDKGIRLNLVGSASVLVDVAMMRRAISNIVSNALRYADPGSTIDVELESGNGFSSMAISNRGENIPEAAVARIFDRFYRADRDGLK